MSADEAKTLLLTLNALIDQLSIPDDPAVSEAVRTIKETLNGSGGHAKYLALRTHLKAFTVLRDEAMQKKADSADGGPLSPELHEEISEVLNHALSLLEKATSSSDDFGDVLGKAIIELKLAKDMVNVRKLSNQLLKTGNEMAAANQLFHSNLAEIAHAMLSHQKHIDSLETELAYQKKLSREDELTKCYNRTAFDSRSRKAVAESRGNGTPLCLMYLDFDNFREVNNRFGTRAGDDVLVNFAVILRKMLNTNKNQLFRHGDDEFSVLLANTGLDQAHQLAERLRAYMESHDYVFEGHKFKITISVGVGSLREGESRWDLMERAGRLLHQAKNLGRNRVCRQGES